MLFHPDGSMMLSHFIRPEFLVALLEMRAFHLFRQDQQSDKDDGKLPAACFDKPYRGLIEQSLRLSPELLKSHANAIARNRERTFIMSWTYDPSEHMQREFGENGERCELQVSEMNLKRMLGYEWFPAAELPPQLRPVAEIPSAHATVQLKDPLYTDGTHPISVVPSYYATAHKAEKRSVEAEARIEAFIKPDTLQIGPSDILIRWPVVSFNGLSVKIGSQVSQPEIAKIELLAAELNIPLMRFRPRENDEPKTSRLYSFRLSGCAMPAHMRWPPLPSHDSDESLRHRQTAILHRRPHAADSHDQTDARISCRVTPLAVATSRRMALSVPIRRGL